MKQVDLDTRISGWDLLDTTKKLAPPADTDPLFVDPYEIASADPFQMYRFDLKEVEGGNVAKFLDLFKSIAGEVGMESAISDLLSQLQSSHKDAKTITITAEQITQIVDVLCGDEKYAAFAKQFTAIKEVSDQMTEEQKEKVGALKKKEEPPKEIIPQEPNTTNFHSEHMREAAKVHAELTQKYAKELADLRVKTPAASHKDIQVAQNKVSALARMKMIEYTATVFPPQVGGQAAWDTLRAEFTHDKTQLPEYIPSIEYTR